MHLATLLARPHRCVSRHQRQARPVANAAKGCRLGLLNAAHASLAGATRNEKCQFSGPLLVTLDFLRLKPFMGRPRATLKTWRRSSQPFQSYKRTDRQTDRHAHRALYKCMRYVYNSSHHDRSAANMYSYWLLTWPVTSYVYMMSHWLGACVTSYILQTEW